MEKISENKMFGGCQQYWKHYSEACAAEMTFSVYLPPNAENSPVLYWLSGLTCTADNFTHKAGAQRIAAQLGLVIVCPDTSPRGEGVADADRYDLGKGAGFYVDAVQDPWCQHYKMQTYIAEELPQLIEENFPVDPSRRAVSGHSMGGHGALITALRCPGRFRSVSAFAPIVNPLNCPWGKLAFSTYLGEEQNLWKEWDCCELIKSGAELPATLIDQGDADQFLQEQLLPGKLQELQSSLPQLQFRMQPGYDHSYYFIASFIEEHLRFHARHLVK